MPNFPAWYYKWLDEMEAGYKKAMEKMTEYESD